MKCPYNSFEDCYESECPAYGDKKRLNANGETQHNVYCKFAEGIAAPPQKTVTTNNYYYNTNNNKGE